MLSALRLGLALLRRCPFVDDASDSSSERIVLRLALVLVSALGAGGFSGDFSSPIEDFRLTPLC